MDFSWLAAEGLDRLPHFLTSLGLGLLMGLERERNPTARAGLRTFALVAVLGTVCGTLSQTQGAPWMTVAFKLGLIGATGGVDMLRRCLPGLASTAVGTAVGLLLFA